MKKAHLLTVAGAGLVAASLPISAATAQGAMDFYKNRTLTIYPGLFTLAA